MEKSRSKNPKYFIKTFGCQMNYSDSERFDQIFQNSGFIKAENSNDADLLIFNSCSVRQKAEDRILGLGKQITKLKIHNPKLITILTGCMARRMWDNREGTKINILWRENLKKKMPWLDLIVETKKFHNIISILNQNNLFHAQNETKYDKFYDIIPKYQNKSQAFLPISDGCDHFCSFCIVPYARGREICRPFDDIFTEFKDLVKNGYKDIILVGQIVNRWIAPKYRGKLNPKDVNKNIINNKNPSDFLQLIKKFDSIDGDYWISYISSHPNYFTDELIDYHKNSKHLKPHLHLALQSGNNDVLANMKRNYTYEEFKLICDKFRKAVPDIAITTDIIVGFPGETKKQFLDTANAMKRLKFDMAFLNEYSPRTGTKSANLKNNISKTEKEKRKDILNEILKQTSGFQKKQAIGKILKCLSYKTKNNKTYLRTAKNRDCVVNQKINLGEFHRIKIANSTPWALEGEVR